MKKETKDLQSYNKSLHPEYGSTSKKTQVPLNDIYEEIGLGPSQYLYWTVVALISYFDNAELALQAVLIPTLRCEWQLTPVFESAITVSAYGLYAVCAALFGKVADKIGRKTVLGSATFIMLLAAMGAAFSPNKWSFLACRMVTGACIGTNYNCIICYCIEFAESKYRTYSLTVFMIAVHGSECVTNLLAYWLLHSVGWRVFIMAVSVPVIPAIILVFALPESPRFLCVSGQQERAMKAVRFMAKLNKTDLPDNIQLVCYNANDEDLGSYAMILNQDHRKTTCSLSVIYFCNIFIGFGLALLVPLMFNPGICEGEVTTSSNQMICEGLSQTDILKLCLVTFICMFGLIAAVVAAQCVGRLTPLRLTSTFVMIATASLFACVNDTFTLITSTLCKLAYCTLNILIWIIIPESFPTNVRSTAVGFINGWGKTGGAIGASCVYLLFYFSPYLLLGLFLFCSVVGCVTTFVYDIETKDVILRDT